MIYQGSRYTRTSLYDRRGTLLFNQRNRISFGKKNCVIHTYSVADRLDNLAVKYYGNPQLYWVILDANPQYRCELDIKKGDRLIIPSFEEVRECLNL